MTSSADGRGARHLLVVEDEPVIAGLFVEVLAASGYQVTACTTVEAGLAAARGTPDFALGIADFLLPDGTGLLLARELARLRPNLRLVLVSACFEADLEEQLRALPSVVRIVRKPLDVFELANLVGELLADGAASAAPPNVREASC